MRGNIKRILSFGVEVNKAQIELTCGRADSCGQATAAAAVTTNECIKLTQIKHFKFF
jgi:hypothetical protein